MIDISNYALVIEDHTADARRHGRYIPTTLNEGPRIQMEVRHLTEDRLVTVAFGDNRQETRLMLAQKLVAQGWSRQDAEMFAVRR